MEESIFVPLIFMQHCFFVLGTGQEKAVGGDLGDADSGQGTMTSSGSQASLNSNHSSSNTALPTSTTPMDNPEQFESLKQQKEIWEQGIEM